MSEFDDKTEFEGGGVMPNTVHPKGEEAVTASDALRLMSITGQETDTRAPVNPYFWQGNDWPDDEAAIEADRRAREARRSALVREERNRYKETRRSQY